jgi:erythromycin esterase
MLICIALLAGATPSARAQSEQNTAEVVSWARSHVFPLSSVDPGTANEDLKPFERIIGQARVVGLGEPDHGIHEFLAFRNRLLEYLVESTRISAIAAETGYSESVAVDDYVQGHGTLTPAVIGSVFSWSASVAYGENRALIEWLRAYNARPTTKRKIHFYGLDLTGGRAGRFTEGRKTIEAALEFVSAVDSAQARRLRERFTPRLPQFTSGGYDSLTATDKDALTAAIDDLISLFERRQILWSTQTSVGAYERAYHESVVARQLNANFRAARAESNPQAHRETAMAQNLKWILDREGPEGRVFLFAANWHVSKGPMVTDRFGSALGEHLLATLEQDYVAIGATFNKEEGETQSSIEPGSAAAVLSQVGTPQCVLDLTDKPRTGPVTDWLKTNHGLRGGRIDSMVLGEAFNAVVFLETVHPASRPG